MTKNNCKLKETANQIIELELLLLFTSFFSRKDAQVGQQQTSQRIGNDLGYAFTLAEVLITLVIIGVVSVLFLPTIINKVHGYANMRAHQVFHKKIDNAITMMQGNNALGGYQTTEEFVEQFKKYIKVAKVCGNSHLVECFTGKVTSADGKREIAIQNGMKLSNFSQNCNGTTCEPYTPDTNAVGLILQDGTNILIAYRADVIPSNNINNGPDYSALSIVYDLNGGNKPNRVSGINNFKYTLANGRQNGQLFSFINDIGKINAPYFDEFTAEEIFIADCENNNGRVVGDDLCRPIGELACEAVGGKVYGKKCAAWRSNITWNTATANGTNYTSWCENNFLPGMSIPRTQAAARIEITAMLQAMIVFPGNPSGSGYFLTGQKYSGDTSRALDIDVNNGVIFNDNLYPMCSSSYSWVYALCTGNISY